MFSHLTFVTTNDAKFLQVSQLFEEHSLKIQQRSIELIEPNFDDLAEIAKYKCEQAYAQVKAPVVVDDSGFFFKAYPNFPGVRSAWVYRTLGYQGLMALLENQERQAYAQTAACLTVDGKEYQTFLGTLHGEISTVPSHYQPLNSRMPYKDIFYPLGEKDNLNTLPFEKYKRIGHRELAFSKVLNYIDEKY